MLVFGQKFKRTRDASYSLIYGGLLFVFLSYFLPLLQADRWLGRLWFCSEGSRAEHASSELHAAAAGGPGKTCRRAGCFSTLLPVSTSSCFLCFFYKLSSEMVCIQSIRVSLFLSPHVKDNFCGFRHNLGGRVLGRREWSGDLSIGLL